MPLLVGVLHCCNGRCCLRPQGRQWQAHPRKGRTSLASHTCRTGMPQHLSASRRFSGRHKRPEQELRCSALHTCLLAIKVSCRRPLSNSSAARTSSTGISLAIATDPKASTALIYEMCILTSRISVSCPERVLRRSSGLRRLSCLYIRRFLLQHNP